MQSKSVQNKSAERKSAERKSGSSSLASIVEPTECNLELPAEHKSAANNQRFGLHKMNKSRR